MVRLPGTAEGLFTLNVSQYLKGKIDYRDAGAGVDFRSTRISDISFDDASHTVVIHGTGVNANQAVTFTVSAVDNGETGTTDRFSISLSSGYSHSGTLTRGNIQIQ